MAKVIRPPSAKSHSSRSWQESPMQTFGSHWPSIRFATPSLKLNFTAKSCVHLHHPMTLADSSLLSLTPIECGNREVSNNWVNKVCRFLLTCAWIIPLQHRQSWSWNAWIIWLWLATTATWHFKKKKKKNSVAPSCDPPDGLHSSKALPKVPVQNRILLLFLV